MRTHRRTVSAVAGPGILAARQVYLCVPSEVVRVAALVEISAAAAALARTVVKLRRLDPDLIAPHVASRVDLRAVLGRGAWLPTMCRHVPVPNGDSVDLAALAPVVRPVRRRVARRRITGAGQPGLFPVPTTVGRG